MPASYGPEKSTVVQWYLTVAPGRETNLSQKAEKPSGYGIFRLKNCRDTGYLAGGIEEIRDIFRNGSALRTCSNLTVFFP